MIWTDYIALLALSASLYLWWRRGLEQRSQWLLFATMLAMAAGAWSIADDRWQAGFVIVPCALMLLGLLMGRKRRRIGVPWISGTLFTLLAALAVLLIWYFPIEDLPPPSGEYIVGVRDFELQDTSRPGLISAGPQEPRRLLVRVWYPASESRGYPVRQYFSDAEADTTAESIGRFLNAPFAFKYLKHVKTNSYEEAPFRNGLGTLPVVVYSHGYTSFAGQNTALMEELASHGYTVYSVQHSYDSGPTVMPNGDVLESDPMLLQEMGAMAEPSDAVKQGFIGRTYSERREGQVKAHQEALATNQRIAARSAPIWTDDRVFVLDQLQSGAVPDSVRDIVAAGDFEHTGQIGMSFGGSTTGEFCFVDQRCAAGVNLDGGDFHFTSFGQNEPVPFLMFYSDFGQIAKLFGGGPDADAHGFNDFSYERPETAGLRTDVVRLKVNSVTHLGVSDFTLFVRPPLRNPLFGSIDSHDMIQIQNDFVLGFFDKYVRNQENAFPAEQFAAHKAWVEPQSLDELREDWLQSHPRDQTIRVSLETTLGKVDLALYPQRAPLAVAQFLAAVDGGKYERGKLHRTVLAESGGPLQIAMWAPGESTLTEASRLEGSATNEPFTEFNVSESSGIPNEAGALVLLFTLQNDGAPGFFINISENLRGHPGDTRVPPAAPGQVTIGRVLRGLPLLRKIRADAQSLADMAEASGTTREQQGVGLLRAYQED